MGISKPESNSINQYFARISARMDFNGIAQVPIMKWSDEMASRARRSLAAVIARDGACYDAVMVAKPALLDPVLAAGENAPLEEESEEERAAVLASVKESRGSVAVPHDEVIRKLAARR